MSPMNCWPKVPLVKVATLQRGFDLPVKKRTPGNFPVFAANGVHGSHRESKVKGPGVVTGRSGTIGKVHYVDNDFWPLNTSLYVKDFNGNDPKWIYYMLANFRLERFSQGAGVPTLNRNLVHHIEIPLPPLPEQKRIAAILDKADAIRRKRWQAIKLADDFLRATFLDMFGDPVTNPKGWDVAKVIDVCDCIVPGRDKPKSFSGDIPWIMTDDLNPLSITAKSKKQLGLSKDEIKQVRARVIPKDSVVMTCVGDLGISSIVGSSCVINQQLHSFQCSDKINNSYLMYNLSFQSPYMYQVATLTTVPYLNKTNCNCTPLPLPPIFLQDRFAEICRKVWSFETKLQNLEKKTFYLFNSLTQRAFRGELQ